MIPVRKSLRPETFPVLNGKGRAASYRDLVSSTILSVAKVSKEEKLIPPEGKDLKLYLKDGGAGQMPTLKSKVSVNDEENMFQYGHTIEDDEFH